MFFIAYVLFSLRLPYVKSEGKAGKQKTLPKSFKTDIKILTNPGFA